MWPLPPVTMYFISGVGPGNVPARSFSNVFAMRALGIVRGSLTHDWLPDDASNGICHEARAPYLSERESARRRWCCPSCDYSCQRRPVVSYSHCVYRDETAGVLMGRRQARTKPEEYRHIQIQTARVPADQATSTSRKVRLLWRPVY